MDSLSDENTSPLALADADEIESAGGNEDTYSLATVETAITAYLSKHQNQPKVSALLIKSGLFDFLTDGIIRLRTKAVPEELQAEFFCDHLLLRNWTKDQTDDLEAEYVDLTAETEVLKEERKILELELDKFRNSRAHPVAPAQTTPAAQTTLAPTAPAGKGALPAHIVSAVIVGQKPSAQAKS